MPIGKYKGRLIQEVMQIDPSYIQWCLAAPWFREQHPAQLQVNQWRYRAARDA
jgi:hypothetical protein